MMTREEFETALTVFQRMAVADHTWREAAIPMEDAAPFYYDKILAAYDAQAAEICQLRERNAELAAQRLELDDRAYYEGRIAELEAQRDALLKVLDQRGCNGMVHECAIYERCAIELKQMLRFMMNEYDKRIGLWYINEEELTAIREALDET